MSVLDNEYILNKYTEYETAQRQIPRFGTLFYWIHYMNQYCDKDIALHFDHFWLIFDGNTIITIAPFKRAPNNISLKEAAVCDVAGFFIAKDNIQAIHAAFPPGCCADAK